MKHGRVSTPKEYREEFHEQIDSIKARIAAQQRA